MEPHPSPAQLIANSKGLLLDFDGPVCDVYAGSDPARIARGVAIAFALDIETDDPLDLITHALEHDGPVDEIHQALAATEIEAVRTATETPGARTLIETYHGPVAIVSNNAYEAIEAWLTLAGLRDLVDVVIGRDPRHMKPDPRPLVVAATAISQTLSKCIFVGDSLSDVEAASRAQAPVVALANDAGKRARFEADGCKAIVDDMLDLVTMSE